MYFIIVCSVGKRKMNRHKKIYDKVGYFPLRIVKKRIFMLREQQIFRILEKTDGFCSGLLYQEKPFLQMSLKRRVAI